MATAQLINTGNEYEIADDRNSEIPTWPVQDQGAHWHSSEFEGQRVVYDCARVEFGFLANIMSDEEVAALDLDDLPSEVYSVGLDFYRAV